MNFLTIDFETYYDSDYSLTKMSTEDYVNDPRFEVILVGVKVNNAPPVWFSGTMEETANFLQQFDIPNSAMNAHNNAFDGLILAVHFGLYPALYCDTMLMAQAILKPYQRSISLDSCMKAIDLGIQKGDEVYNMKGRPRLSLSPAELQRYANYCMTDCEAEFRLFKYLAGQLPREELEIIDMTLRMYLQPKLVLDPTLLAEHLQEVQAKKAQSLASLPAGIDKSVLMSNVKFAEILKEYGIDPPVKISATTDKATWAFAKNDAAWKELEEEYEDDPTISAILSARLSAKSTLEETRSQRLLDSSLRYPRFRAPLKYHAAHTGRYGGTEGINIQNFPQARKSRLRFAIRAPKGFVVLAADLSQIEARIVAWLAGQKDLVQDFENKVDTYSKFATTAYKVETIKGRSKEDDMRRFIGKGCILGLGYGMGAPKLKNTLRKDDVKIDLTESYMLVETFRNKYDRIPMLWRRFDRDLAIMAQGGQSKVGPLTLVKDSILLPNGMPIHYNNLRQIQTEKYQGWVYDFAGEVRTLWGGKVTENVTQALAFVLIKDYAREIKRRLQLQLMMQQHDELDYLVLEKYAEKYALAIAKIMRVRPWWAPDLPVDVEVNFGPTFGDCK